MRDPSQARGHSIFGLLVSRRITLGIAGRPDPGNRTDVDAAPVNGNIETSDTGGELHERRVEAILSYLNQHGYQMASFERLRQKLDLTLTDDEFRQLIANSRAILR